MRVGVYKMANRTQQHTTAAGHAGAGGVRPDEVWKSGQKIWRSFLAE
eukprot:COSAG01_NODE_3553_length_5934_cov_4.175282_3_plen_47_part_00